MAVNNTNEEAIRDALTTAAGSEQITKARTSATKVIQIIATYRHFKCSNTDVCKVSTESRPLDVTLLSGVDINVMQIAAVMTNHVELWIFHRLIPPTIRVSRNLLNRGIYHCRPFAMISKSAIIFGRRV